jgi:ribulose-phosphate 3-epimerase
MEARSLLATPRVAPSILSADFARLGDQVAEVLDAGAKVIHVDVMDGRFVPPITMGPIVVEALREQATAAGALLDVHMMISEPERQVEAFAAAGADVITVHAEATAHAHRLLGAIREAGALAGLAVCPATPPDVYEQVAGLVDVALVMTVNPGWGGQPFIPEMLAKVRRVRELAPEAVIEVDGGVDPGTAGACVEAGAKLLVAGSAVFRAPDVSAAYGAVAAAGGCG